MDVMRDASCVQSLEITRFVAVSSQPVLQGWMNSPQETHQSAPEENLSLTLILRDQLTCLS